MEVVDGNTGENILIDLHDIEIGEIQNINIICNNKHIKGRFQVSEVEASQT